MIYIGDARCKYNALSPHIRCSVNPDGPCDGCQDFEKVRDVMLIDNNDRDIHPNNTKTKLWRLWERLQLPLHMLQLICVLTVGYLLWTKQYPISKETIVAAFSQNSQLIGCLLVLLRIRRSRRYPELYPEFDSATWFAPVFWAGIFVFAVRILA